MNRRLLLIGLLLAVVALALATWQQQRSRSRSLTPEEIARALQPSVPALRGKPAAEFELPSLDGHILRRADFKDKVLLVNFWATWCHPCLIEIPWFIEFQKKYGPQGLEVIGISLDEEGPQVVKKFVDEQQMTYTILMGNEKVAERFGGIIGLPTTYLVDRQGKYYSVHRGLVSRDIVEEELLTLLNGAPADPTP